MPKKNSSQTPTTKTAQPKDVDAVVLKEFGGTPGAIFVMISSHITVYYLWMCLHHNDAAVIYPSGFYEVVPFLQRSWHYISTYAAPSWHAAAIYFGFLIIQAIFACVMPGVVVTGLPVPSEGGRKLQYRANGVYSWYATLILVALLHYFDLFKLSTVYDNLGPIMTVAALFGNATTLIAHFTAWYYGKAIRMSGSFFYDLFMGSWLNPRFGLFDLKYWAETRVAWIMLFLLTASCAVKQYQLEGTIGAPMIFMLLAHGLYANACMKGEEMVVYTWDIFYEKWGWMLIFWNFCGVPFVYCLQSVYVFKHGLLAHSSPTYSAILFGTLILAYYVWDTAQSQRNRYRMQERGTYIPRKTFPQLPWGTLKYPPELMKTPHGTLLVDGWWKYARKIHYTCDIVMGLSWGLNCMFENFLPYFYVCFFTVMILHRYTRDDERCRRKYGKHWDEYCKRVPYIFIPFVF